MKLKTIAAGLLLGAALAVPAVPALGQAQPGPTEVTIGATSTPEAVSTPSVPITPVVQSSPAVVVQPVPINQSAPAVVAQPAPTARPGAPTLAPTRPAVTTTTQTTPRAGGLPTGLALPLLAGGGAALAGAVYLLRRGRRP